MGSQLSKQANSITEPSNHQPFSTYTYMYPNPNSKPSKKHNQHVATSRVEVKIQKDQLFLLHGLLGGT